MPHVNVTINKRQYRMACAEGEEQRLADLAADFDGRIERMRGDFGEIGDMRLAVMAALTLSDELLESRRRTQALEDELSRLKEAAARSIEHQRTSEAELARQLEGAAERIEQLSRSLNQSLAPAVPIG